MTEKKINCWEHLKCGREPGGSKVKELGVCPAATDTTFDKVNYGQKAGRCCWAVAKTLCMGHVQLSLKKKRKTCKKCSFYKLVLTEEGGHLVLDIEVMDEIAPSEDTAEN